QVYNESEDIENARAVCGEQPERPKGEDDEACRESVQVGEEEGAGYKQDCRKGGHWFVRFVNHDLLLLENQIPFFIVKTIFELVTDNCASSQCLTDDLAKYVEAALRWYPKAITDSDRPKDFHHLLHLCHIYFQPSQKLEEDHNYKFVPQYIHSFLSFGRKYFRINYYLENNRHDSSFQNEVDLAQGGDQLNRWRRAAQYLEAGIKFKKREYDKLKPHSLLDIWFSNGSMDIPCIVVDEYTGSLFRNLIAFEQTCPQFGDDFTAYIVFLSQLISMPEDVTLLIQRKIIVHQLDSDERVSDLFTMLSKDVVFDFNGNYYLKLCARLWKLTIKVSSIGGWHGSG
ncbi:Os04g0647425, partial [Oryza sativa Japonica Group]